MLKVTQFKQVPEANPHIVEVEHFRILYQWSHNYLFEILQFMMGLVVIYGKAL